MISQKGSYKKRPKEKKKSHYLFHDLKSIREMILKLTLKLPKKLITIQTSEKNNVLDTGGLLTTKHQNIDINRI